MIVSPSRRPHRSGFTVVETVFAVALLSLTAVMGSRALLISTRSLQHMVNMKRASALNGMIFQQYVSYVNQNYQVLNAYDKPAPGVPPKDFFNTPDNMGYDNFLVTTSAAYSTNRSTCVVTVQLTWHEGGDLRTTTQTKVFSQTNATPLGGAIQVFVKSACNGAGILSESCPGYAGFIISAPSSLPGQTVTGPTNAQGIALLMGVRVGSSVPIQITAPTASDYSVSPTMAGYVQGYFTTDASGANIVTLASSTVSSEASLSKVYITTFQPAGRLFGTAYDQSDPSFPALPGTQVILNSGSAALNGSYQACGTGYVCSVTADGTGQYSFNNIIHANTVILNMVGLAGSAPGDPTLVQGYTQPLATTFPGTQFLTFGDTVRQDVGLVKRGSLTAHVIDATNGSPMPAANVAMIFSTLPSAVSCMTNASGNCSIYNVLADDTPTAQVIAGKAPQGGDLGTLGQGNWACTAPPCIGRDNPYTVSAFAGYTLNTQFTDLNPSPIIVGANAYQMTEAFWLGSPISASGNALINGFYPALSTDDASVPFQSWLAIENDAVHVMIPVSVNTIDQLTGFGAPMASFQLFTNSGSGASYVAYQTDATGHYTGTVPIPLDVETNYTTACDGATHQCTLCMASQPCDPNGAPTIIPMDSRTSRVSLEIPQNVQGYVCQEAMTIPDPSLPSAQVNTWCALQSYSVQGMVKDSMTLRPLAGVEVRDGMGALVGVTADGSGAAAAGSYAGWAAVQTPGVGGNPRSVSLSVLSQTLNSTQYGGLQQVIAIPDDAVVNPTVPLTANFTLPSSNLASGAI